MIIRYLDHKGWDLESRVFNRAYGFRVYGLGSRGLRDRGFEVLRAWKVGL